MINTNINKSLLDNRHEVHISGRTQTCLQNTKESNKLIPGLRYLSYEEILKECGLTTLEMRILRGDQIEVIKILNGHENIDPNTFVKIKTGKITRGHDFTLVKGQSRLEFRKYYFS